MTWHVCGTSLPSSAAATANRLSHDVLNWALTGAPSATRTRDLLLRRQLLYPLSYRGRTATARPCRPCRT